MRPSALLTRALDVVFPPRCVSCSAFGAYICESCLDHSPRADGDRCPRCWSPGRAESCLTCYRHLPSFDSLRAAFCYGGPPRDAVRALKFHGLSAVAPLMARHMYQALLTSGLVARGSSPEPGDLTIVPVPLGTLRKRTRGYNQSELLAGELARLTGLPYAPNVLRRTRSTRPQTEQPDEAARRRNIEGAFAARRPVRGRVLLIDDVSTTGATLDACARALHAAGATRVHALTFARED